MFTAVCLDFAHVHCWFACLMNSPKEKRGLRTASAAGLPESKLVKTAKVRVLLVFLISLLISTLAADGHV